MDTGADQPAIENTGNSLVPSLYADDGLDYAFALAELAESIRRQNGAPRALVPKVPTATGTPLTLKAVRALFAEPCSPNPLVAVHYRRFF